MQSSRDSSVWRSLAVAFGDGLAFGVGMTLTQPASRASAAAPQTDLSSLGLRLEQMEQRIAEVEQRPRALSPLEKGGLPPAHPFDQKVLEAVVNALDARLHEQSGHVERQLTELQAKITIELKTLHLQDRSIADGLQERMEELQRQFTGELAAIRQAADADRRVMQEQVAGWRREVAGRIAESLQARVVELQEQFAGQIEGIRNAAESDRRAMQQQLAALRHELAGLVAESTQFRVELQERLSEELEAGRKSAEADRQAAQEQMAALHREASEGIGTQLQTMQQQFREELRQAVEQVAAATTSAANAAAEERIAPLREAVAAKDQEIAELRGRIAGNDEATLDLLQGVGEICRRAAQRLAVPEAPPPEAPSGHEEAVDEAPVEAPLVPVVERHDEGMAPASDEELPAFAQSQPPGRLWRVPLVSSVVLTTGVMFMLHYL